MSWRPRGWRPKVKHYPDFERSEFEARWKKAASLMDAHQIDALLLCSNENLRYFTGFKIEIPMMKWFPFFAVIPGSKRFEPVLVVDEWCEGQALATSWIDDIRLPLYQGQVFQAVLEGLVKALRDLGLSAATIGMEFGFATRLGITVQQLDWLKESLPGARFVDGSDVIWACRRVKSSAEIEAIKVACDIAAAGIEVAAKVVKPGMTEAELYNHVVSSYYRNGGEGPHFFDIMSTAAGPQVRHAQPAPYALEKGGFMKLDGGPRYKGYQCDWCRVIAIGPLTEPRRRGFQMSIETNAAAMAAIKPGRSISEVGRAADEYLHSQNYFEYHRFMGHGVGLDVHEPPIIQPDNPEVLVPGNVLTIEIGNMDPDNLDDGTYTLEDLGVVTDTGWRILTDRVPPDVIVV